MSSAAITLPLMAAFVYVCATLFIKKAVSGGASAAQVNLWANLAMTLIMQPLWLLAKTPAGWTGPAICGALFFLGQCFTFAALSRGDVSVATPLMGTKILFISGFAVLLFRVRPSWDWWAAIGLSTLAVVFVTFQPRRKKIPGLAATAAFATAAAAFFGLTDLLVQHWCEPETLASFFALMFIANATLSTAWFFAACRGTSPLPSERARKPLAAGAALLAVQVLLLGIALGLFDNAAATNILYATRSLWSVVLAWAAGRRFASHDAEAGTGVMLLRLSGAVLLFASILLIVL